ncbi:rod shape-determining protein MreD [Candidatus Pelagibacter bacterium nBUS_36]|uniref:rod shape-determining protein MreD n=1 Tax=Candidatus Pelagibacter bacterium nBUS_36 TaxID=3374194 RepID=UPI003EC06325|tara:strand:+ start:1307 stop:1825 length:519 start_codon:yes stop_codon:yes gene_type:complete
MSSLNKAPISNIIFSYFPIVVLFISAFNEFDFNYLKIQYFSFNFIHILIFFWTLKNPNHLGYISIFMAGVVNDVIVGLPLGVSSFCYLLICSVTAYVRNITLSPNFINDWLSFLFTILLVNSVQVIILDLIFLIQVDYMKYLINTGFTFIFYPLFFFIFNYVNKKIIVKLND